MQSLISLMAHKDTADLYNGPANIDGDGTRSLRNDPYGQGFKAERWGRKVMALGLEARRQDLRLRKVNKKSVDNL